MVAIAFFNIFSVDFDKLLMQPRFKSIEKIKTIGATYMAASGLNPNHRVSTRFFYVNVLLATCHVTADHMGLEYTIFCQSNRILGE